MKRTPLRRVSEKGATRAALHKLWRECLLARDGERCAAQGWFNMRCGGPWQGHHVWGQGANPSLAMRYNLQNGVILCAAHHKFGVHAASPIEVRAWLVHTVGEQRLANLEALAHVSRRSRKRADPVATKLFLIQELKRLQGGKP